MARAAANWASVVADAPDHPFAALLDHYLSSQHRDDPGKGCAFAALGADAARSGKVVRRRLCRRPGIPDRHFDDCHSGTSKTVRRRKAVAAMASLVGTLTLARAVRGTALSDELLVAVPAANYWPSPRAERMVHLFPKCS